MKWFLTQPTSRHRVDAVLTRRDGLLVVTEHPGALRHVAQHLLWLWVPAIVGVAALEYFQVGGAGWISAAVVAAGLALLSRHLWRRAGAAERGDAPELVFDATRRMVFDDEQLWHTFDQLQKLVVSFNSDSQVWSVAVYGLREPRTIATSIDREESMVVARQLSAYTGLAIEEF